MAADRHSRVVGWLRVALPLMALGVLATLFLLSERIDPEDALPYADVDVDDRIREPRMIAPSYAGTTSDGASIQLTADEARPATEGASAQAKGLRMELATPDGGKTELRAATAEIDRAANRMVLTGGVTIDTSTGYRMETPGISALLDRTALESIGEVTAAGPLGDLRAGGLSLTQDTRTPGGYVLVFNRGVRLVYQPDV